MTPSFRFYVCVSPDPGTAYPESWVGCIYRTELQYLNVVVSFVQLLRERFGGYINVNSSTVKQLKVKRVYE